MTTVPKFLQGYLGVALKYAAIVGAVCAVVTELLLPAAGVAHIAVPTWVSVVVGAVGGAVAAFQRWATDHGVTPAKLVAKLKRR